MAEPDDIPRPTAEMLAKVEPGSMITYEDDVLCDTGEAVWNVLVDGETVASFVVGEDDFDDAEANAEHLTAELREVAERDGKLAEIAFGLREVADWIEANPEFGVPDMATIRWFTAVSTRDARPTMKAFGLALGDGVTEEIERPDSLYPEVVVSRSFGGVEVKMGATVQQVGGVKPAPAITVAPLLQPSAESEAKAA